MRDPDHLRHLAVPRPSWSEEDAARQLASWLSDVYAHDRVALSRLRKGAIAHHLDTAFPRRFAFRECDAEVYAGVARLFAVYTRKHMATTPLPGAGSMGKALAKLATTKREKRTADRLMTGILRRQQPPWRELELACVTLREKKVHPPSWQQLTLELTHWGTRNGGRDGQGPRSVADSWVRDYHGIPSKPFNTRPRDSRG